MVIESGILRIKPGGESHFEAAVAETRYVLEGAAGCRKVELRRGVENPSEYLLLVEWDSVDHHLAFAASDSFSTWLGAIGGSLAGPPELFHYCEPLSRSVSPAPNS